MITRGTGEERHGEEGGESGTGGLKMNRRKGKTLALLLLLRGVRAGHCVGEGVKYDRRKKGNNMLIRPNVFVQTMCSVVVPAASQIEACFMVLQFSVIAITITTHPGVVCGLLSFIIKEMK